VTAAGVWLGKLVTAVGSGPTLIGIAVGGVVVGTVGSLTLGGRAAALQDQGDPLPLFACPDAATVIGQIQPGEQVLVTGRSDDGTWLEVHFPDGKQGRAWGEWAAFTLDADPGALPVSGCGPAHSAPSAPAASLTVTANYSPSPGPTRGQPSPGPSLAASPEPSLTPTPSPTPSPTPHPTATAKGSPTKGPSPAPTPTPTPTLTPTPTPTPAPTPTNDTTPPSLSNLTANPSTISYAPDCPDTTTITVSTDPSGVQSITLWYDPPGGTLGWTSKAMTFWIGNASSATWRTTLSTVWPGWDQGQTPFYVVASDGVNTSQLNAVTPVTVQACFG
jgi:hypothetical protein